MNALHSFSHALCHSGQGLGGCRIAHLGLGIDNLTLDLRWLCRETSSSFHSFRGLPGAERYVCNRTRTPACTQICGEGQLGLEDFQSYTDFVLSRNPFSGAGDVTLKPWEVPQADLSEEGAFVFQSQRQALYVALRTLALKIRSPTSTATGSAARGTSSTNALEYGLTYGCNWIPPSLDPKACAEFAPLTGVGVEGIQGNVFSLLAWAHTLARESGAGLGLKGCFRRQRTNYEIWCAHDSVLGAVRGGRSGPDAQAMLDTTSFWAQHNVSLSEVGTRPNVCHFEHSRWVWRNTADPNGSAGRQSNSSSSSQYCSGAPDAPGTYGPEIRDFMSVDRPWSLAVDIAGAQYGGGCGSASGATYATQDESTPVFYPETMALSFHSSGRSIGTGATALLFLGVRRYFTGQSGSHGLDEQGLRRPLFDSGNPCGSLHAAELLVGKALLSDAEVTQVGTRSDESLQTVQMYGHALGVITSSCGSCADGNLPNTSLKFRTAGQTCLVRWKDGRSSCGSVPEGGWTYWQDVWIWLGALWTDFYPEAARPAMRKVVRRIATGPWGAGVWWGNTLQYFVIVWLATALLWSRDPESQAVAGPQLDYYAYGQAGQPWPPLGGFCEQYQAQGYEEVVRNLASIDTALDSLKQQPVMLGSLYQALIDCSRCDRQCVFSGVGPPPSQIYCTTPCTPDFLECFVKRIRDLGVGEDSEYFA